MVSNRKGFTLIELLVVIAIIGILATLVITQVAGARVRANNSSAQSDVSQGGRAIETWKSTNSLDNPLAASNTTYSTGNVAQTTMGSSTSATAAAGSWTAFFNTGGTSTTTYPVTISKTPSTSYSYGYVTDTASAASYYCLATNISTSSGVTASAFGIVNGSSKTLAATTTVTYSAPSATNAGCN